MPFSNRDRPRLIERLRGKSGQDLFNEVKSALNSDSRRMLFDTPSWSNRNTAFRGFPFDDEPLSSRPRRSFVDRPFGDGPSGLASELHEPPWEEDGVERKRRVVEPEVPAQPSPLSHHGLRNTVPFAQTPNTERPGRAMSAPPGERPPRFTSTCEIPVTGEPVAQQPPPQQQQSSSQPNNVRLIPIQVEGRDEPLVNSNIDTSTNFAADPPQFDARLPRDFGPFRKHSARFQQSPPHQPQYPPQQPQQFQQQPTKQQQFHQQQAPKQQQNFQQPPKQQQNFQQPPRQNFQQQPPKQQQQQEAAKSTDEPDRVAPPDPTTIALSRIADVQREVDNLAKQVSEATLTSRKDKQYVYLDEMLTRQLLRLDDIDPAGQDNVRQARKDVIKTIQQNISNLERKVPGEAMDVDEQVQTATAEASEEAMAVASEESAPAEATSPSAEAPSNEQPA